MSHDRMRVRTLARVYDWRLTHATATTDEYRLAHTDEVLLALRYADEDRLINANLRDSRQQPAAVDRTDSILTVAIWLEGVGSQSVFAQTETLFDHIDSSGNGLRLDRAVNGITQVEDFWWRVLDSAGGTLAATKMDRHVLDHLGTTIGEL